VDLAQVVDQRFLIDDLEHFHQAIAPQRLDPGEIVAQKEEVAGK
jgi:hypothetical protein